MVTQILLPKGLSLPLFYLFWLHSFSLIFTIGYGTTQAPREPSCSRYSPYLHCVPAIQPPFGNQDWPFQPVGVTPFAAYWFSGLWIPRWSSGSLILRLISIEPLLCPWLKQILGTKTSKPAQLKVPEMRSIILRSLAHFYPWFLGSYATSCETSPSFQGGISQQFQLSFQWIIPPFNQTSPFWVLGDVNFTGMSSPQHFLYCEIDSLIRSRAIGNAMTVDKAFCEYVYQIVVLAEAL